MESKEENMDAIFRISEGSPEGNSQDNFLESFSPGTSEFVMANYLSVDQQRIGTTTREQTHASMMHSSAASVGNEPVQYSAQESKVDASNKPAVCATGVERSQDSAATFKRKKRAASMMDFDIDAFFKEDIAGSSVGGTVLPQQQKQQIYDYKPQLQQQQQMQKHQQYQMQKQQQMRQQQPMRQQQQMQQQQQMHLLKQEGQQQKIMEIQDFLTQLLHSLSSGKSTADSAQESKVDASNKPAVCARGVERSQDSAATLKGKKRSASMMEFDIDAFFKEDMAGPSVGETVLPQQQKQQIYDYKPQMQQKQQIHLVKQERQQQQKIMVPLDFLMQLLHSLSSGKSQLSKHNKDIHVDDVIKQLIGPSSPSSTSSADEILASIIEAKEEQQTQQTLSSSKDVSESGDEEKIKTIREIIERCDQTESRKIQVHQFVLAFLVAAHCRMSSTGLSELLTFSTEDGGDTDMMSENFAVRDKEAVGRIWNKLKENQKGRYDTFARAMRLGRERKKGYFVYQMRERGPRN